MKISFGLILYNEQDLIHQQLTNLYPHAHEIILVVGRTLEFGDKFPKEPDQTIKIIESFPDPDKKIILVAKDTWTGKDQMVGIYYTKATGDYVWHIDADEFYSDTCIKNTIEFIDKTKSYNYAHYEYFYYRYYNVIVAKDKTKKFWNRPARIHKKHPKGRLQHRPQLLAGHNESNIHYIPKTVGIRHHYSIMDIEKVRIKARFYGYGIHSKYFPTYDKHIHDLVTNEVSVRPDNDRKQNNFVYVLRPGELEIPNGIDTLHDYYENAKYPWTLRKRQKICVVVDDPHYDVEIANSKNVPKADVIIACGPLDNHLDGEIITIQNTKREAALGITGYGPLKLEKSPPKLEKNVEPLQTSWSTISAKNADVYLEQYPTHSKTQLATYLKKRFNSKNKTPRILELGCGSLSAYNVLSKTSLKFEYTGVDFSLPLINSAKKKDPKINVIYQDIYDYLKSYNGPKYDVILLCHTFELVDSQDLILHLSAKHGSLIAILWYEPPTHKFHMTELKVSAHPQDTKYAPYLRIKTSTDYYKHLVDKHGLKVVHKVVNPTLATDLLHVLESK